MIMQYWYRKNKWAGPMNTISSSSILSQDKSKWGSREHHYHSWRLNIFTFRKKQREAGKSPLKAC
jgi:hypothetical protein